MTPQCRTRPNEDIRDLEMVFKESLFPSCTICSQLRADLVRAHKSTNFTRPPPLKLMLRPADRPGFPSGCTIFLSQSLLGRRFLYCELSNRSHFENGHSGSSTSHRIRISRTLRTRCSHHCACCPRPRSGAGTGRRRIPQTVAQSAGSGRKGGRVALSRRRPHRARRTSQPRPTGQLRIHFGLLHAGSAPATPEQIHRATEQQERVRSILARMEHRQAEFLVLQSHGFRYDEIASILDLNATSVGTLLARAQQAFRKEYSRRYGHE